MSNKNKDTYFVKWWGEMLHIYDPVFRMNYWYQTIKTFDKAQALIKKLGIKHEYKQDCGGGFSVHERFGQEVCLIWTRGSKSDIVHECCHAAGYIFDRAEIKLNKETDELYAYYVSFLYKAITGKQ